VLSAVLVFAGTTMLALSTRQFAMVNIVLVCAWLVLAVLVGREYRRLVSKANGNTISAGAGKTP